MKIDEHKLNQFCIGIQKRIKSDSKIERDKERSIINPKVRKRDNYLCHFCKKNVLDISLSNSIHHIVPERYAGKNNEDNLITICLECHNKLEKLINKVEIQAIISVLEYLKEEERIGYP